MTAFHELGNSRDVQHGKRHTQRCHIIRALLPLSRSCGEQSMTSQEAPRSYPNACSPRDQFARALSQSQRTEVVPLSRRSLPFYPILAISCSSLRFAWSHERKPPCHTTLQFKCLSSKSFNKQFSDQSDKVEWIGRYHLVPPCTTSLSNLSTSRQRCVAETS